ncbi:MAG: hypothetical protein DI536_08560 [Archangium gephyra]|uniref:Concanavalin A-like lectin/glucanase superfamily protein n=1 Tax=Archangium gephyra TaxID=48 RepID=A0A2W5TIW9_9BACT|nr:MAG: hypothetical protein DI536_08560 [Archangium gephyra]
MFRPFRFACVVVLQGCVGLISEVPPDAGEPDASVWDAGLHDAGDDDDDDDAGVDAGVDAGRACPPRAWCENFEGDDAGWRPQLSDDGGLFTAVPPAGSRSPGRALRVELERGRATLQVAPAQFFTPDAGYHVFGRALFFGERMPGDAESRRHGWVTLEGLSPMHGTYSQVGFRHDSGRTPFANFFVINPWQDCWGSGQPAARATPVGRWFCYEWEFDSAAGALRMWQDGELQVEAVGMGSGCTDGMATRPWVLPAQPSLGIGLYTYDDVSLRAWVDDVVLAETRVGCD